MQRSVGLSESVVEQQQNKQMAEKIKTSIGGKKLLFSNLIAFFLGSCFANVWFSMRPPGCACNCETKREDVSPQLPSGFEVRTILRPNKPEKPNKSLLLDPDVLENIGEKPCKCAGDRHKEYFKDEQWKKRRKEQEKALKRFERRRIDLPDVKNHVDGFSPLSYPAHGLTVRPLRAVRLEGLRIEWFDANDIFRGAELSVEFRAKRGMFRTLVSVESVHVEGRDTNKMILRSRSPTQLNLQLKHIVYQNTLFDANIFDNVDVRYLKFRAKVPIHIQHRRLPWLYEPGAGRIQDRVTTVIKTFLRYDNLRRLIKSINKFYPGIRIIIADDNPTNQFQRIHGPNVSHYKMPELMGYFAGRNLGLSQVTTEYFFSTDDDHILTNRTDLRVLVNLLDKTNFHLVSGADEHRVRKFACTLRVTGNSTHVCLEQRRQQYHEIPGFPGCYAADHTINFFVASTAHVKAVGFDPHPAQARNGHQEFFAAALGRLRIAACKNITVGHIHFGDGRFKGYRNYRYPDKEYYVMKGKQNLFKYNLTCYGPPGGPAPPAF